MSQRVNASVAPFPLDPPLSTADFDAPQLQSFEAQVAGHPSTVFRTRGGQIVVKRALPAEIRFYYTHLASSQDSQASSRLAPVELALLTPKCHGAVTLSEPDDSDSDEKSSSKKPLKAVIQAAPLLPKLVNLNPSIELQTLDLADEANALVLENVLHGFVAPSVLDIKLGTQLWDESSTPEKRERMIKAAETCTTAEFGARLTGWQTWDEAQQRPFTVSKLYGKSILTKSELEMGARIFFCSPRHPADTAKYNQVMGNGASEKKKPVAALPSLPSELVHHVVVKGLIPQLADIFNLVKDIEWRVRGGSVLLVYEGSQAALEHKLRTSPSNVASFCKARLIDFAHASFVPGQGPDDGYVQGLQTAMELLQHVAAETAPIPNAS
ncbi:hypothetical protein OC835_005669 [Tilletia horrida]|nr:hypothetical protein OC835_005669 [Tilletia horrida]